MVKYIKYRFYIVLVLCTTVLFTGGCRKKADTDLPNGLQISAAGESTGLTQTDILEFGEEIPKSLITGSAGVSETLAAGETEPPNKEYYVHIAGAVNNPGVYKMAPSDRIFHVVEAAGGFAEGACEDYINLSLMVQDGLMIKIPTVAEMEQSGMGSAKARGVSGLIPNQSPYGTNEAAAAASSLQTPYGLNTDASAAQGQGNTGLVNINTADISTLCTLNGIGEQKAKAIIAYRQKQGGFKTIEQLMEVSGIGQGSFNKIKDYICV